MQAHDTDTSFMPAVIRYSLGLFVLLTVAPMIGALTLPFLLFGPLAAPFCLMAFLGDWSEEREEFARAATQPTVRRYRARELVHA